LGIKAKWEHFRVLYQCIASFSPQEAKTIFNIRQNRYRLITVVHHSKMRDDKQTEGTSTSDPP
jgi:mRNA-degrading endonuclease HigB of HigAB toxin-antitoxin module